MANQVTSNELIFAILTGFVPSFIWLIFWLKRDRGHKQPWGIFAVCFILGGIGVAFASFFEKITQQTISDHTTQIIMFVAIEEILKFSAAYFVGIKSSFDTDAVDPAIYMMSAALGFAAVENVLYVLHPSTGFSITTGLLTGGLRFFGSTLLHSIASGFIGIMIGLSPSFFKKTGALLGLIGAIFLHATFNFFILRNDTASFLQIYGYLWIAAIISYLILEKLHRISAISASPLEQSTYVN